jgi:hypothetical protein
LVQVVAIALGVVQRARMTMVESIVGFLRPRLLVVLDNCEHLLDAAAELVQAILAGAPRVRVLATSRDGLGVAGKHLWPLPSLALPSVLLGAAGRRRGRAVTKQRGSGGLDRGPRLLAQDGLGGQDGLIAACVVVMVPAGRDRHRPMARRPNSDAGTAASRASNDQ